MAVARTMGSTTPIRRPDSNLQRIQAGQMGQMGQLQDMAITNRRPSNPNLQGINALQGYPIQNQGNVPGYGASTGGVYSAQGGSSKGGIDFGGNMTDFQNLTPAEQTQGQILGIGKTLQDYLFGATKEVDIIDPETGEVTGTEIVSDYEAFVPSDSYVPSMEDVPGFTQALEAAQGGLGQYQEYFSGGADEMNRATGQAQLGGDQAKDFANRTVQGADVTKALANQIANTARGEIGSARALGNREVDSARSAVDAARLQGNRLAGATQGLGNRIANQSRFEVGGDLGREEALTALSVANAQSTQNRMNELGRPGAATAYMDPYQNAVIQDTLRRLNEQGMQAQNQASASAVQSGAFGGSRGGVMQAQLGQRLQDTKADYLNKAMSQNFLQAQNAAQGAATLAGQGGQLAQGAYTTGSGRAIQGGQLALGAGELGARTALQGGELATRTAMQGGELGLKAGQLGADTALRGGQLALQGGQLGTDAALKGGQLGLQAGQLGAQTSLSAGELGAQTALKLGQGLGALGTAASETDQREITNLAKLGLAPMDVLQQAALAQQGNELSQAYSGMRDFSILGDYYRGVPSSQSVGISQGAAGVSNPWAAGIGGGLAGLQAGRVLGG